MLFFFSSRFVGPSAQYVITYIVNIPINLKVVKSSEQNKICLDGKLNYNTYLK
jgi:hypothetical protein